jgi:hypothetical protein
MSHVRGRASAALGFEWRVRSDLHRRRWVRAHVFLVSLVTFAVLWGLSHALMVAGVDSLAVRHGVALVGAYVVYLALLGVWCRWLLSRDEGWFDGGDLSVDVPTPSGSGGPADAPVFRSGGGDFGGGGAGGSFDVPGDGLAAAADAGSSSVGKVASAAAEVVGGADEGAVVFVPVALAVGVAVALLTVLGFAVFGLFGVEILMGVAVEIAFASAGGALAMKAQREGWLQHAVRRTAVPMVVVLAGTVFVGLAIAQWLPQARTLPQALQLMLA